MTETTQVGHCKHDSHDTYIGRGPDQANLSDTEIGSRGWLGNPYPVAEVESRAASIEAFRADFVARIKTDDEFRAAVRDLHGQTLGCWCRTASEDGPACHGDVIAEWADKLTENSQ